jgi:serine/threonine-protein kinase ULK/ATG1
MQVLQRRYAVLREYQTSPMNSSAHFDRLYMAPEILRYEKYDAKADLWSVGAVLYEMSVGRPPFKAKNHIDLLKRIEQARSTVKFPDEDPNSRTSDSIPVKDDIKLLIRMLLKRHAVERASYEEFFKSDALKNSKFTRSERQRHPKTPSEESTSRAETRPVDLWVHEPGKEIPETHKIIPSEVLDPKAHFPPSSFDFRSKGVLKNAGTTGMFSNNYG